MVFSKPGITYFIRHCPLLRCETNVQCHQDPWKSEATGIPYGTREAMAYFVAHPELVSSISPKQLAEIKVYRPFFTLTGVGDC